MSNFVNQALQDLKKMAALKTASSARYTTYKNDKPYTTYGPCFHAISSQLQGSKGLSVCFMGYNGFEKGETFRKATWDELTTDKAYPFPYTSACHYNEYSLEWLRFLLHPDGPFKSILPHLHETDPEKVQEQQGFIFPDAQALPGKLAWCFLIASRVGVANARVLWTYLLLREQGMSMDTASLLCGGFASEVVPEAGSNTKLKTTGRLIKSYTAGWLGVDTTAYARRWLDHDPKSELPFKDTSQHTNGSAKTFLSGKVDMKNLRFDDWAAVEAYTMTRYEEQGSKEGQKAA